MLSLLSIQFVNLAADPSKSEANSTEGTNMPTVKLEGLIDGAKTKQKLPGNGLQFR